LSDGSVGVVFEEQLTLLPVLFAEQVNYWLVKRVPISRKYYDCFIVPQKGFERKTKKNSYMALVLVLLNMHFESPSAKRTIKVSCCLEILPVSLFPNRPTKASFHSTPNRTKRLLDISQCRDF
jgi:hypothetical protein